MHSNPLLLGYIKKSVTTGMLSAIVLDIKDDQYMVVYVHHQKMPK